MATDRSPTELKQYDKLFIGGQWVEPATTNRFETVNPANGKPWAVVPEGNAEDVDRAVKAARKAFNSGPWPAMAPTDRAACLRRLGDLVLKHADRLAELETTDNGKTIRETRDIEMNAIAKWYYYFAGLAETIEGATIPVGPDFHTCTIREPVGVCGCILPWNSPLLMAAFKLGPALAAGNTVVLKPAEQTPVTALELANLISEAGFPPGVVNIITGFGDTAGAAIVKHPGVDKISFTGGSDTGRLIAREASDSVKRITLELGGKSPNIVFDDCNIDEAVSGAMVGVFTAAGQSCIAGSRLFLHDRIYDEFLERLAGRAGRIRVGQPMDRDSQMGAQTCKLQWEKIKSLVDSGIKQGAEVITGGQPPDDPELANGYFFRPTVFANVNHDMRIAQEEIFGPVVSVFRFSDEDEVIQMANDVRFGLAGAVWTRDIKRAYRVTRRLDAGIVWVNTYRKIHWAVPQGGFKLSGYGSENGKEVMNLYTRLKTMWVNLSDDYSDPYAP